MRKCFDYVSDLTSGVYKLFLSSNQEIFVYAYNIFTGTPYTRARNADMEGDAL